MTLTVHIEDIHTPILGLFSAVLAGVSVRVWAIAPSGAAPTASLEGTAPMGCSLLLVVGAAGTKKLRFFIPIFGLAKSEK